MDYCRTVLEKVIKKGKVNGIEVSYALAMMGTIVLDVVHVFHA